MLRSKQLARLKKAGGVAGGQLQKECSHGDCFEVSWHGCKNRGLGGCIPPPVANTMLG